MYLPQSYEIALLFMIGNMLCWGSWANTMKLCPRYRFQLFYWDYVICLFVGIFALGLTLGEAGEIGKPFVQDVLSAPRAAILLAICGGAAPLVGALSSYLISPQGNPCLLFGGIALVIIAIVCDSLAHPNARSRSQK